MEKLKDLPISEKIDFAIHRALYSSRNAIIVNVKGFTQDEVIEALAPNLGKVKYSTVEQLLSDKYRDHLPTSDAEAWVISGYNPKIVKDQGIKVEDKIQSIIRGTIANSKQI